MKGIEKEIGEIKEAVYNMGKHLQHFFGRVAKEGESSHSKKEEGNSEWIKFKKLEMSIFSRINPDS